MATFLRSSRPIAHKAHRCDFCTVTIDPGMVYTCDVGIDAGRIFNVKACAECDDLHLTVWEWCGGPDEGVMVEDYMAWAADQRHASEEARAFLTRRGDM